MTTISGTSSIPLMTFDIQTPLDRQEASDTSCTQAEKIAAFEELSELVSQKSTITIDLTDKQTSPGKGALAFLIERISEVAELFKLYFERIKCKIKECEIKKSVNWSISLSSHQVEQERCSI